MNYSLIIVLLAAVVLTTSCKKDDAPDPLQERLEAMAFTWNVTEALADGENVALTGVTLTFTAAGNYTISGLAVLNEQNLNNSAVLSASGSFSISADNLDVAVLDNDAANKTVNIISVDASALSISFQSNYPKVGDEKKTIRLNATRAN